MSLLFEKLRRAFTIVELVIVMAAIAILAAVLIPTFSNIISRSKGSKALQEARNVIEKLTPVFSEYHVDLVLQAHDHTFNKTLPYIWDSEGYTTTYNNSEVVNFDVNTYEYNGMTYDLNPNGTYYVTTGAAGHRYGEFEKSDGIWADVNDSNFTNIHPTKGFINNTYKIEVGRITQNNKYVPYTYDNCTSDQIFNVGDYASGNVNAPMFGILTLTEKTLTYQFYTVQGNTVKLFDTLNVMKNN